MTTLVVSGAQALGGALVQTASQAALTFLWPRACRGSGDMGLAS